MRAEELLLALLEATPEPPNAETDVEDLMSAAADCMARREPLFAELQARVAGGERLSAKMRAQLDELTLRDARWIALMNRARHLLHERRRAVAQYR